MAVKWKTLVLILTPLLLLPLPLLIDGPEAQAGYGMLIITIYSISQCIPLQATALLPIVMFPFMNILSTKEVCALYFKESNFIFFGGVTLALAVEKSNLHSRIALRSVLLFGTDPRWLMLGLMSSGMLLSFWIPNAGLTAMLLPIVQGVLDEILPIDDDVENGEAATIALVDKSSTEKIKSDECINYAYRRRVRTAMFLAISYSVGFGGTGTLIASGAPITMKGIIDGLYGSNTELNFATWMVVGVPIAVINTLLSWVWLQTYFLGCSEFCKRGEGNSQKEGVESKMQEQYRKLGPLTYHEKSTITLFSLFILICFFKKPQFLPGWQDLISDRKIGDATVSVAIAFLTFVLPSTKPNFWCFKKSKQSLHELPAKRTTILEWKYLEKKFPWGNIIIIGGSFAVADAARHSGLSFWIGSQLSGLKVLPPIVVMLLVCIVGSMLTEVTANSAASSILLPIVAQIAEEIRINPLYLMMPVTISCSYAFMFPIGNPMNTMVFTAGRMKPGDMAKPGILLNVYTVLIVCAVTEIIGTGVFDLHTFPEWAMDTNQAVNHTMALTPTP